MSIIRSHTMTLYGGYGSDVILRPLNDSHLPCLCKWCADPEVLYWTEGGTDDCELTYTPETVREIYGGVSQNAFCFLIEAAGRPVGECWLQKMNIPSVQAMYGSSVDVRRIDMSIGEKAYWGRGIGTKLIGMLMDFAFNGQHVDALHCFCEDYNIRSCRIWEKHGFRRVLEEELPQPQKGRYQYHYRLTRQEYVNRCRYCPTDFFTLPLSALQPSQLCVSEGKLRNVQEWFGRERTLDPIPVKTVNGVYMMTDGHTRAVAACIAGWHKIPVYMDTDTLDMEAYAENVRWCLADKIFSPCDLAKRIVSYQDYQELWIKRCMEQSS